jgi:phosphate transport system substrate-binding protein
MNSSSLKKSIALGAAIVALALTSNLQAAVSVFIEGGSASQNVLYDRATNLFAGGTFTSTGTGASTVRRFQGSSLNPALSGFGTITLDINVANGAINGLVALVNQTADVNDTNVLGAQVVPTFVDSATSPEAIGIDSVAANLSAYQTYVVPLVFIKNTNFPAVNAITNLTQRQAVSLVTSLNPATFYGGNTTNLVYFVGRNSQAAVRTEIDLNVYNTANIKTFTNNPAGLPVQDTSADPGLAAGGAVANTVLALTNSIGTVAVQNIKTSLTAIPYEGVPYSAANVINGSYPIWGYENYYFITAPNTGSPSTAQKAVLDAFYSSVTNAAFASSPVFTNNFIPTASLKVKRDYDGGPIKPLPGY